MKKRIQSIVSRTALCLLLTFSFSAQSAQATEDDCYYLGKGLLGLAGTGLDLYGIYSLAQMEYRYQSSQIELQQLMSMMYSGHSSPETAERINELQKKILKYTAIKSLIQQFGDNLSVSALLDKAGC